MCVNSQAEEFFKLHQEAFQDIYAAHSSAWKPFLESQIGSQLTKIILGETQQLFEKLISEVPYIGGDENPMTRHLIRSITSLVLYKVMKSYGWSPEEIGKIVYDTVTASVNQLPRSTFELTEDFITSEEELARLSPHYPGDWSWKFVEGDGETFDYGYDFFECGTQKLYHLHDTDEFLPYYCYLDFVTQRTTGWGFFRTMTLAEGYSKCDFRWNKGGITLKEWPPPFVKGN